MKLESCVLYPGEWLQICRMLCDREYYNLRFQQVSTQAEDVLDMEIHHLESGGFKLETQVNLAITDPNLLSGWLPRRVMAEIHETWFIDYETLFSPAPPISSKVPPLIDGSIRINAKGLPVTLAGTWQLSPLAEGVQRKGELDLQVNVPLMGNSIANKLAVLLPAYADMERKCAEEYLQNS